MKKLSIIILIITLSWGIVCSQEIIKENPRVYKAEDGKLYINKQLPVYLWLSISPDDNAPAYRLMSDSSKQYSNPMYFDTEGLNTVRSPWAVDTVSKQTVYPLQDIVFEVYADSKPPVTTAKFSGKNTVVRGGNTFYNGNVEVSIISNDEVSGVLSTYISIDGKPYEKYLKPVIISQDGKHSLLYYSTDKVGNNEKPNEKTVIIDNTAPATSFNIDGVKNGNFVSPNAKIVLSSTDELSGVKTIYYRVNQGNEYPYTAPIPASRLADGKTQISFYAVDFLGNRENPKTIGNVVSKNSAENDNKNEKVVFEFYIDNAPPSINYKIEGDQAKGIYLFISPRTQILFSADDDKSGVENIYFSINTNALNEVYSKPVVIGNQGLQYIYYKAVDFVGNSSVPSSLKVYVDSKPPVAAITMTGLKYTKKDTLYVGKNILFSLQGNDNESGLGSIFYNIDNGAFEKYEKPFTIKDGGFHKIQFYAADKVNNKSEEKSVGFYVDLLPPDIHYQYSVVAIGSKKVRDEEYTIYPTNTQIYLGATDKESGGEIIQYSVNGGPLRTELPIKNLLPGNYIIKIIATDVLKNKSEKEIKFSIEK
jgi:hypothetical protein